jgi:predicted ATPase
MPQLKSVKIEGFRSIKQMELELRPINVCIGANGAGKSNLIAFFKMINELMGGRLQQYIATTGRATGNLHFGPRVTPQFEAQMEFEAENGTDIYQIRMFHAAGDSLIFAEELISFHQPGFVTPKRMRPFSIG